MRFLKVALTSARRARIGGGRGAVLARISSARPARPAPPPLRLMAMPVPVTPVIKKTLSIYLDYPGRTESIREHRLAGAQSPATLTLSPPRTART